MAGFSIQRDKFVNVNNLIASVISDMTANGFSLVFPTAAISLTSPATAFSATLAASATVDSLALSQPWRVHFTVIDQYQAKMYVASDVQLPSDGSTSTLEQGLGLGAADSAGVIGTDLPYPYQLNGTTLIPPVQDPTTGTQYPIATYATMVRVNNADSQFIDRTVRIPDAATAQSYPMSYLLNISAHGFSLCIWEEDQDPTGNKYSWVVVQRPVDRVTGVPMVDTGTSHTPLFCVYGLRDMYIPGSVGGITTKYYTSVARYESGIKQFVVRESDVYKPSMSRPASYDSADQNGIINDKQQVSITENNQYVITFPNKLNTMRYAYTSELDLIGYTSADVVSQETAVPLTVYGESTARTYTAIVSNGANNTNMRLLMLTAGGGATGI